MTTKPFRGGRVFSDDESAISSGPARRGYPCFAAQCPMAGAIFTGTKDAAGSCAYHHGANPSDIPRITQVILDWSCVADEINAARTLLTGPAAADPKAIDDAYRAAWARMKPLVHTWSEQLQPGAIRDAKGQLQSSREGYGDWVKRLQAFLDARIREAVQSRPPQSRARAHLPTEEGAEA